MGFDFLKKFISPFLSKRNSVGYQAQPDTEAEPQDPEALNESGKALFAAGNMAEALTKFEKALVLDKNFAAASNNRGAALSQLNRLDEALASFQTTLEIEPDNLNTRYNLAKALLDLERWDEALGSYDLYLSTVPDSSEGHNGRGVALKSLRRWDEALLCFDAALDRNPDHIDALWNKGLLQHYLGCHDEAIACMAKILSIAPQNSNANFFKACLLLLQGQYGEGWRLFEWRWHINDKEIPKSFEKPLWLGKEDIRGKTLLIYPEQGLGDYIQFFRYGSLLKAQGIDVVLEVPTPLYPMTLSNDRLGRSFREGDALPEFDYCCPVMSLPLACSTFTDKIPSEVPYLFADQNKGRELAARLGPARGPRIGLVWSGNPDHKNDHNRSMSLTTLMPLLELPLDFHCLQKEIRRADRETIANGAAITVHSDAIGDFSDTAALIEAMDLVISVDTSVAHLAAAMGKPVWIALQFAPDYRWLLTRRDSPWYPSARLFRQPAADDWDSVIRELGQGLRSLYPA